MLALVIEEVKLFRIEIKPRFLVGDDGVVFPAIPQAKHDAGEFARAVVAVGVRDMAVAVEVQRFGGGERGDEVPAGAAVADLVERGEEARHVIGLEIGRGHGGDEADLLRHDGERAQQGQRLEPRGRGGAAPGLDVVGAEGRVGVGGEQQVELAALGGAGDLGEMLERLARVNVDVRIAPGGDVMAAALEEQSEFHHRAGAVFPASGMARLVRVFGGRSRSYAHAGQLFERRIDRHPITIRKPVGLVGHADDAHQFAEHGFRHASLARGGGVAGDAIAAAVGDADGDDRSFP